MVATRQLYMRHNDSLRRATRVERKPIGSRRARHLYRPRGQVARKLGFRCVGENHDFVVRQAGDPRIDRCGEPCRALAFECVHHSLHLGSENIDLEGRNVHVPGIPERNCKQREHQHAEEDVGKRQPGRGEAKDPGHVQSASTRVELIPRESKNETDGLTKRAAGRYVIVHGCSIDSPTA